MSLLFRPRTEQRSTVRIPGLTSSIELGADTAGVYVDADSALRHDAVWSCVTRIAQDVSMMPVDVVRRQNGQRLEVPTPEIIATPSAFVDPMDWRYQLLTSWLTEGNAWGIVTKTTADMRYPLRIELQPHSSIRWMPTATGYQFYVNEVPHDLWPVGDLWHKPAYTVPGAMVGLSPITYHRVTIGLGLAAERFGANFFADGGHPNAILAPATDPGPVASKALKDKFKAITRGNRDVIVVPQDTKYIPIQVNPDDSQFIDAQRYTVEQVCRIFGEDPTDHGAAAGGTSVTYANRSDADLARFKRRQFWVTKLQNVLSSTQPEGIEVKLNTSASLMMTATERHTLHKLRLDSKTTTINEVRTLEDEVPFPDDEFNEPGIPDGSDVSAGGGISPAEAIQKIYLGVGTVITEDEAREIVNDMTGTDLKVPAPDLSPAARSVERAEPVVVNVNYDPPEVRSPDVHVHNEPAAVVVDVQPTTVSVPGAEVRYVQEVPEPRRTVRSVERDESGRIVRVIDEEVAP